MTEILTIAIPTYNRAEYLDVNLNQLCKQLGNLAGELEILVSDNCSGDHTAQIIDKYQDLGYPITYVRNSTNIGSDRNFIQCFDLAKGKYFLLLGDDDLLVDGALERIMKFLIAGEYGLVRLRSYGYDADHRQVVLRKKPPEECCSNPVKFAQGLSYFVTFISGCIVNKYALSKDLNFHSNQFDGTGLPHVHWFLTAAFTDSPNGVVGGYCVAAKRNNSGDTSSSVVCTIFVENINIIFNWFTDKDNQRKPVFQKINNDLLMTCFPYAMLQARAGLNSTFVVKDAYQCLKKAHGRNPRFWLFNAPIVILPRTVCRWVLHLGERLLIRK